MSSYIIAGSAYNIDTAYCEEIARRIKAKYHNIDFRIVIKHPSEWEYYLQQICRIYGFLKKSNPIIYTFDGKIIGNRESFVQTATKYFGIDEEILIVSNLSSKINLKLAEEDLALKKKIKNKTQTLSYQIHSSYDRLLKQRIFKHSIKEKKIFLLNGIEYMYEYFAGLCETMHFAKTKYIAIVEEVVVADDINLMTLSLNDQIKVEEVAGKDAFVTNNDKHLEQDKLSEASKTNKMHSSIASYDKDSKGVQESNKTEQKIDEENDDLSDYIDHPITVELVCELVDKFCVAFDVKSLLQGEMVFYYNEDPNHNCMRVYNDCRPIKGHHAIAKYVYFDSQLSMEEHDLQINRYLSESQNEDDPNPNQSSVPHTPLPNYQTEQQPAHKSRTYPNILELNPLYKEEAISYPETDLNIVSHLSYHTLFLLKPLSPLEIKSLSYFLIQTDTIATLQFLPENPNPKVKLFSRSLVTESSNNHALLPVERFIYKQLYYKAFQSISLHYKAAEQHSGDYFNFVQIEEIGFNHLLYSLIEHQPSQYHLFRIIKLAVEYFLVIEDSLKREIGYNLIWTARMLMIVPIVDCYNQYNGNKFYLDGLAYLGFVNLPKFYYSYQLHYKSPSSAKHLKYILQTCSGMLAYE